MSIPEQIKRNAVAIISLFIAVSSLGYNTWRNELTEDNRNIRTASFEVLKALGELQVIADHAHYERDTVRGNPITGWGHVLLIRDLCRVISAPAAKASTDLHTAWESNWSNLGTEPESIQSITQRINQVRENILLALDKID